MKFVFGNFFKCSKCGIDNENILSFGIYGSLEVNYLRIAQFSGSHLQMYNCVISAAIFLEQNTFRSLHSKQSFNRSLFLACAKSDFSITEISNEAFPKHYYVATG